MGEHIAMTHPSHAALFEDVAAAIKNGLLAVRPSDPDPCLEAGYAEIVSLSEDRRVSSSPSLLPVSAT